MSVPATEPVVTPPTAGPTTDPTTATVEGATVVEPNPSDDVEKWKALSRKNEQRAKENEAAAKRLAEIEEASKSEVEKLRARAETAEKAVADRAAEDEALELRNEVAKEKGVSASVLRGSTREDLEAHADELLTFKGTTPTAPPATTQGKIGDPVGGKDAQLTRADMESMTPAEINEAREAGRFDDLLDGKTT